jgi:hypothetical protein
VFAGSCLNRARLLGSCARWLEIVEEGQVAISHGYEK